MPFLPASISDFMTEEEKYNSCLDYLRKICSAREYCRKDITEKALRRLEEMSLALKAADTLESEGFIDQQRYANAYCRDKATISGWGPIKIRHMLHAKGIPADVIATALKEVDSQKAEGKLAKALSAKHKALKGDPQLRLKLLKFALSRGYEYDSAVKEVDALLR